MASQQQRAVKLLEPVNPPQVAFRVTQEGVDYLSRFSGPLHVVSAVGKMRCGKSYIQKLLAADLGVFELGHTVKPCTDGIDVFVRPHPSGRGHLVLLDVEGQGSTERNATYDAALTTMAMLLSSLVVYNCMTVGGQSDLDNLQLLSGFMQQVIDKTVATTEDEAEGDRADRFFPSLLWLLRDFTLELVDGRGYACDADTYLESVLLAPAKNAATKAAKDKNRMLLDIKHIFSTHRRCLRTLPRPVTNEADFKVIDRQGYSADVVRQEFREQVAVVIRDILAKVGVKKFEGNELNGASFAALAQQLCATLDAEGVPEVTSAWQQVCQQQLKKALDAALAAFKETMVATLAANQPVVPALCRTGLPPPALQTPVREDKLQECIESADASAQQAFFALACAPGDGEAKQLSDSLHTWRKQECESNEEVAGAFCEALLHHLYEPIQAGIRAGTYTREGGFDTYSEQLEQAMLDYNDCCSSCAPVHIAAQRVEAFARRIEQERHLVMENDRALTEAQRQAAKDAEKLQYEQLARKREREEQQAEFNRQQAEHSAQLQAMETSARLMREQMEQQREEDKRLNEQRQAQMEEFARQNQKEGRELMEKMIEVSTKQSEAQSKQMEGIMQTMSVNQKAQLESLAALTQSIAELAKKPPPVVHVGGGGGRRGCVLQ